MSSMKRKNAYDVAQGYTKKQKGAGGLQKRKSFVRKDDLGYVDLAAATYAGDTTGSVTLIPTIAQGTAVTQRVGKRVALKSLEVKGSISANAASVTSEPWFAIVYDKRPTGSLPAITDIYNSNSPDAFPNDANSDRFVILRNKSYIMIGNNTGVTSDHILENIHMYMSLKNSPMVFKALGTGAIADIAEGALYLITGGNVAAGTQASSFYLGFRVRFVDV